MYFFFYFIVTKGNEIISPVLILAKIMSAIEFFNEDLDSLLIEIYKSDISHSCYIKGFLRQENTSLKVFLYSIE